jgi:hypothetical protein
MAEQHHHTQHHIENLIRKVEVLTKATDRAYGSMKRLMWRSFVAGIFTALGATIGVSIVLAVVAYLLSQLRGVPFLEPVIENSQIEKVISPGE